MKRHKTYHLSDFGVQIKTHRAPVLAHQVMPCSHCCLEHTKIWVLKYHLHLSPALQSVLCPYYPVLKRRMHNLRYQAKCFKLIHWGSMNCKCWENFHVILQYQCCYFLYYILSDFMGYLKKSKFGEWAMSRANNIRAIYYDSNNDYMDTSIQF